MNKQELNDLRIMVSVSVEQGMPQELADKWLEVIDGYAHLRELPNRFPVMLRKMWSGDDIKEWLQSEVNAADGVLE